MSAKSNLGKRNDFKHSQPLGVELIDYSFAVTSFRKETDAEVSKMNVQGKAADTLLTASFRQMMNPNGIPLVTVEDLSESITNCKKKRKPRRSMLGQRTKLYNIDSALNITKNLHYGETETEQTDKTLVGTPNENRLKPLYTSFPKSELLQRPQSQRSTEGSNSPPNPFGYEESVSEFFESEINEMGSWSVFKTKQSGIKSPSLCSTGEKSNNKSTKTVAQVPAKAPARKSLKTKLFNRCEDSVVSDKRNTTSVINDKKGKSWPYTSKSSKSSISKSNTKSPKLDLDDKKNPELNVVDGKILYDLDSDAPTSDIENIDLNNECAEKVENNFTWSRENNDDENSDDSFTIAESTVIDSVLLPATKQRSASKAPKLSIICEEDIKNNEKCNEFPDLADSLDEISAESPQQDVNENFKQDLEQLNKQCRTLLMHSEAVDKILEDLLNKKKIYNNYFKQFQEKLNEFNAKYYENNHEKIAEKYINSNGIKNKQKNKKHVISSKVKHNSPAQMLTPENAVASPFTSKSSKCKQSQISKNYSELRKSFSYLKTPEANKVKKKSCRSSICYTPKSLSVCLNEQLQSLDS